MTMPSLFLSHGSPMLAVDDNSTTRFFQSLGETLSKPKAIVMFSAHYDHADSVRITSGSSLETIHDFYGFPEALYQIEYPAQGSTELSQRLANLLKEADLGVELDARRGLDHGAWVPLKWIYPQADIPVIQVSINSRRDAHYHYRLGQALKSLRQEGVLLVGSGGITHNLRAFFTASSDPDVESSHAAKAREFNDWVAQQLSQGQYQNLLNYHELAPYADFNHPTPEHFYPVICALGAIEPDEPASRIHQAMDQNVLSLDAYQLGG